MKSDETGLFLQSILARLRELVLKVAKSYGGLLGSVKFPKFRLVPRLASNPLLLVNTVGPLLGINRQHNSEQIVGQLTPNQVSDFAEQAGPVDLANAEVIRPIFPKTAPPDIIRRSIQSPSPQRRQAPQSQRFSRPQHTEVGQTVERGRDQIFAMHRSKRERTISDFALHVQQTRDFMAKSFAISPERISRIGPLDPAISEGHRKGDVLSLGSAKPPPPANVYLELRQSAILSRTKPEPLVGLQTPSVSRTGRGDNKQSLPVAKPALSNGSDIRVGRVLGFLTQPASGTGLGQPVAVDSIVGTEGPQKKGSRRSVSVPFLARVFASFLQQKLLIGDRRLAPPTSTATLQRAPSRIVDPTTTGVTMAKDASTRLRTFEFLPRADARNSEERNPSVSSSVRPNSRSERNGGAGGFPTASVAFAGQKRLVEPLENLRKAILSINSRIQWNIAPNRIPHAGMKAVGREGKSFSRRADSNSDATKVDEFRIQSLADENPSHLGSDSERGPITIGSSTHFSKDGSTSGGFANKSTFVLPVASVMNYALGMVRALSIRGATRVPTPQVPIEPASSAPVASRSLGQLVSAHSDLEAARTRLQLSNRTRPDWPVLAKLPDDLLDPASNDQYSPRTNNLSAQETLPRLMIPRLSDPAAFQPHVSLPEPASEFEERPLPRFESSFEETDELRSRIARILAEEARRYLGDE